MMELALAGKGRNLADALEYEFSRDSLANREPDFRHRLFDRTVHPTQMYSIKSDLFFEEIIDALIRRKQVSQLLIQRTRANY